MIRDQQRRPTVISRYKYTKIIIQLDRGSFRCTYLANLEKYFLGL